MGSMKKGSHSASLVQSIVDAAEAQIRQGILASGDRLNEKALATEFKVSRGTVREAVRKLEQLGLVTIVLNRGAIVRVVSVEEAFHIFDVRVGLAFAAGRLLSGRITQQELESLAAIEAELERDCSQGKLDSFFELNARFHRELIVSTKNPILIQLDADLTRRFHLFLRAGGIVSPTRASRSLLEHDEILNKIKAGDSEGAAHAFEQHILATKWRTFDSLLTRHAFDEQGIPREHVPALAEA